MKSAHPGEQLAHVGADGQIATFWHPLIYLVAVWPSLYDASPDGQRLLMIKAPGTETSTASAALILVQHWDAELKRLVPTE